MLDAMIIVGDGGGNCNHSWEQRHNVIQLGLRNPFDTLLTLTEVKIGSTDIPGVFFSLDSVRGL